MIKITTILTFPDIITNLFQSSFVQKLAKQKYLNSKSATDYFIDNRTTDLSVTYITEWISQEVLDEYKNLPEVIENRKNRLDYYKITNITILETIEVIPD